jgi:RND family efflux transporter MFP subunit
MKRLSRSVWLLALLPALVVGCGEQGHGPGPGGPPQQVPVVSVSLPVVKSVTDYEDFPGRVEPVNAVEVRARVSGYLLKMYFKEGSEVKKDDLLFEIDPRPYEAALASAEGTVLQNEGRLNRLERDLARANNLINKTAVAREEHDRISGERAETLGTLKAAKASRDMARLNLEWTKVRAPLSGRISRRMIDPGNLVTADQTALTTIVALDPVYAYFDLDERSCLKAQRLLREGKVKWDVDHPLPIYLGLADEEGHFPRRGLIDFADNRVDPDTGTWRLRAVFQNADHALYPGLYVRIRLPIGEPHEAILVAEQALGTDQGQKFVFVVTKAGKVDRRGVKLGRIHDGLRAIQPAEYKEEKGKRVIIRGLEPGERVVVNGLQKIREGMPVRPQIVPMHALEDSAAATKSEIRNPKSETNPKSK